MLESEIAFSKKNAFLKKCKTALGPGFLHYLKNQIFQEKYNSNKNYAFPESQTYNHLTVFKVTMVILLGTGSHCYKQCF